MCVIPDRRDNSLASQRRWTSPVLEINVATTSEHFRANAAHNRALVDELQSA
jgi:hypothetical protein